MTDLTTLSRCELLALKQEIESESREIKVQIEQAKLDFHSSGKRAEPGWFYRSNQTILENGGKLSRITYQLAVLKDRNRAAAAPDPEFSRAFMQIAKKKLTGEQYAEIVAGAKEMAP